MSVYSRAQPIALTACSSTCSGVIRSFICMWIGELAMNVWMRIDFAGFSASPRGARRSRSRARARTRCCRVIAFAMSCTASKSPFDDAGKPASMTSTRSRSSWRAIRVFSSFVIDAPGTLLAVAQRRVENDQVIGHGLLREVDARQAARRTGVASASAPCAKARFTAATTAFSVAVTMFGSSPTP